MVKISESPAATVVNLTDNLLLEQAANQAGQPVRATLAQVSSLVGSGATSITWAGIGAIPPVGVSLFTGYAPTVAATVTWAPSTIGTVRAWWDFSDAAHYTLSGSAYATVSDKSGNNNTLTAVNGPTLQTAAQNGLNTCLFNGTNQYFTMATPLDFTSTGCTVLVVMRAQQTWAYMEPVGHSTNIEARAAEWYLATGPFNMSGAGNEMHSYNPVSTDILHYHCAIMGMNSAGDTGILAVDQYSDLRTVIVTQDSGAVMIYDQVGQGDYNNFTLGWIGELVIFQGLLTTTQTGLAYAEIITKWGALGA